MTLNKDGFEAGVNLSFEQIQSLRVRPAVAVLHPHETVLANPDNVPQTPDVIQMMPKAEVVGWLEAHGVEKPEGKVGELREKLIAIMFADI